MPTETLPAEDMEAAKERLNGILDAAAARHPELVPPEKPAKRTRSDKGTKRPEKPKPAPAGVLTEQQRRELDSRVGNMLRTREQMHAAIHQFDVAQKYYEEYLEALTAK